MGGIGPHLGEILLCENVNFGPLYILTSLDGPTPDLTREHYSLGGPEKNGFRIVYFGPLYILTSLGGPTPDLTREHYSPENAPLQKVKLVRSLQKFTFWAQLPRNPEDRNFKILQQSTELFAYIRRVKNNEKRLVGS